MTLFRFEEFELDLGRMELRRGEIVLGLPRVPMNLLLLLLERDGNLVTRQEIVEALWPGSDPADVFQSINNAVTRIRYTLGDNDPENRIVQTVIGRGYRFAARVERIEVTATEERSPEINSEPAAVLEPSSESPGAFTPGQWSRARIWAIAAVGLCLAVAAILAMRFLPERSRAPEPTHLSFTRLTAKAAGNPITAAGLSPDGNLVAFSDADGLKLQSVADGSVHSLHAPENVTTSRLAWSPDGMHLVQSGVDQVTNKPQLWLLSSTGDPPVLLRDMASFGVPSPDGTRIAFLSVERNEVWVMSAAGEGARRLLAGNPGDYFSVLLWSANSRSVLLQKQTAFSDQSQATPSSVSLLLPFNASYIAVDAASGNVTASEPDVWFDDACLDVHGDLIFVRPPPRTAGAGTTLVRVSLNPVTGAFASRPTPIGELPLRIVAVTSAARSGAMAALAQQSFPHVFVGELHWPGPTLDAVQRLSSDDANAYPHSWAHDGRTVLYESDLVGHYQIYRQQLGHLDSAAIVPSSYGQVTPRMTYDDHWILYAAEGHGLFRTRPANGTPEQVTTHGSTDFRCASSANVCVLRSQTKANEYFFSSLDPIKGEGEVLFRASTEWGAISDWDVSPDGKRLVCVSSPPGGTSQVHTVVLQTGSVGNVPVPKDLHLRTVNWVPDRGGWIIGASIAHGGSLLYLDEKGRPFPLRQTWVPPYGVPSPDGKRLAFLDLDVQGNIWMLKPEVQ